MKYMICLSDSSRCTVYPQLKYHHSNLNQKQLFIYKDCEQIDGSKFWQKFNP